MIRELKRRLMSVMMVSFTLIIVALIAFVVFVPETQKKSEIRRSLEGITGNNERKLEPEREELTPPREKLEFRDDPSSLEPLPERPENAPSEVPRPEESIDLKLLKEYGGNVISIEVDDEGNISSWTSQIEDYYSDETIQNILDNISETKNDFGYKNGYYYLLHVTPEGRSYTVLDSSSSLNDFRRTLMWGIIGGIISWIVLFFLSLKLTAMMVKPIEDAFDNETRFLSDASHELKTPLAVIKANADVLKEECGGNKWIEYIITETNRMDKLVKDLLFLTVSNKNRKEFSLINFSHITEGTMLPFEALAYEKNILIKGDIKDNVFIRGDEKEIEKLVSILLSNAVKYAYENTQIDVTLSLKYKNAILSVRNEGIGVKEGDKDKIFKRFYRVDKARRRDDGSYGLGLAMADTIAKTHNAKLTLESEWEKWIEFTFEIRAE